MMSSDDDKNYKYFQYFKGQGIPLFLRADLGDFNSNLHSFLVGLKFEELTNDEIDKMNGQLAGDDTSRLLTLQLASPIVAKQIDMIRATDKYGNESIVPKTGYHVYRYAEVGVMVYSLSSTEWTFGCFSDFGGQEVELASKCIINRYLSWALSSMGLVGFWGVPVDEGIVVLSQAQSKGEAVFIDIVKHKLLSLDGIRKIKGKFFILRLDANLHGRNVTMKTEELLSFLTQHNAYFDYNGLPVRQRQMTQALSKMAMGLVHPLESFKPRTDLSL